MKIGRLEISFMVQPPETLQFVCDGMVSRYGEAAVYSALVTSVGVARSRRRMAARMDLIVARPDRFAARCLRARITP